MLRRLTHLASPEHGVANKVVICSDYMPNDRQHLSRLSPSFALLVFRVRCLGALQKDIDAGELPSLLTAFNLADKILDKSGRYEEAWKPAETESGTIEFPFRSLATVVACQGVRHGGELGQERECRNGARAHVRRSPKAQHQTS